MAAGLSGKNLPFAPKLQCKPDGYKSLLKAQRENYEPLFRTKLTLDDSGKTPVKFYDERRKRMTPEQIAEIDWRGVSLNIILTFSSVYVNAGSWGCVASPNSILVKDLADDPFSSSENEFGP